VATSKTQQWLHGTGQTKFLNARFATMVNGMANSGGSCEVSVLSVARLKLHQRHILACDVQQGNAGSAEQLLLMRNRR
jgi:hypothetical protein